MSECVWPQGPPLAPPTFQTGKKKKKKKNAHLLFYRVMKRLLTLSSAVNYRVSNVAQFCVFLVLFFFSFFGFFFRSATLCCCRPSSHLGVIICPNEVASTHVRPSFTPSLVQCMQSTVYASGALLCSSATPRADAMLTRISVETRPHPG